MFFSSYIIFVITGNNNEIKFQLIAQPYFKTFKAEFPYVKFSKM